MAKSDTHRWQFRARFRRGAFGWKSEPAIKRIKEAVSEIKKVARKEQLLAAEGAVLFLEKVSPAIEHVDGSSGSIGAAVNDAIAALVPIIAKASAETKTRAAWLERLFEAHGEDQIPYIESLADHWGELCATPELATEWADRLLDVTRTALSQDEDRRGYFHGTTACLSALYAANRHDEILGVLEGERFWPYRRWAVRALVAQGKKSQAIRYAEDGRNSSASDHRIDRMCEEILLSSGLANEAYTRYGLTANRTGTYLAWFRAVKRKYPEKQPSEILKDLVELSPGDEGKWFAAAKSEELFDEAIALANLSPCSPQTLTRAARDFVAKNPTFALESGMTAIRWLIEGYGYEVSSKHVLDAYSFTMQAATHADCAEETQQRIRELIASETFGDCLVSKTLGPRLEFA
jgi:hypothetical protein